MAVAWAISSIFVATRVHGVGKAIIVAPLNAAGQRSPEMPAEMSDRVSVLVKRAHRGITEKDSDLRPAPLLTLDLAGTAMERCKALYEGETKADPRRCSRWLYTIETLE